MEEKYYAINLYYDGTKTHIWVESTRAKDYEEAEIALGDSNPQFILTEEEAKQLVEILTRELYGTQT